MASADPAFAVQVHGDGTRSVSLSGRWTVWTVAAIDADLREVEQHPALRVTFDLGSVTALDTAGAWLLVRTARALQAFGTDIAFENMGPEAAALVAAVEGPPAGRRRQEPPQPAGHLILERVGAAAMAQFGLLREIAAFYGVVAEAAWRTVRNPRRFRMTSFIHHMDTAGFDAVPIICLMAFLIGGVLAYQGAGQLQRFGAEVFTVNLVALSQLREIAILLTAIMVAGRSGSAFAAQIGAMKSNEEIDAMRALALDPVEVLVLPRLAALTIALPLLGFLAMLSGLLGGWIVLWSELGISALQYVTLLRQAATVNDFWVGIVKAPVFGAVIAMIGCYEGFQVTGSAQSVGERTTAAVVLGVFSVIVLAAAFSLLFFQLGI